MFLELFITSFSGIVKVFLIGFAGAVMLGGLKIRQGILDVLSALFVRVALPCLIFTNMVSQFRPDEVEHWWVFPLLAIGLFAGGGFLAWFYSRIDRTVGNREVFSASVAFHNSIMLPLAIAPVLFHDSRLEQFLSLLFLYNLLAVPAFFTVGIWLMHSANGTKRSVWNFLNPPNIATVSGITIAAFGFHDAVPSWIMSPMRSFGALTSPLSMIIVGGIVLVSIPKARGEDWADPVKIMILKSLVLPVLACAGIWLFRPPEYMALFLALGSAMPVGSTLAVVCPPDESLQKQIAGGIVLTSLASIPAVSLTMSVFALLYT